MRKIVIVAVSMLLTLAAALTVLLPAYRAMESARRTEAGANRLIQLLETMDPELVRKHRNLAMWYNLTIRSGSDLKEAQEAYGGILNLGNGEMGVLEVPGMDLALPIYHGDGMGKPELVHRPESSLPVGGMGNHAVMELADTYGTAVLEKLETGELIRIHTPGTIVTYRVEEIVSSAGGERYALTAEKGKDLFTLVIRRNGEEIYLRCGREETLPAAYIQGSGMDSIPVLAAAAGAAGAGMMPWILGALGKRILRKRRKRAGIRR